MQTPSRYLGVDVSKDLLVVAFERNRWQFPNSKEGYRKLIAQIRQQRGPIHVVCEATGPYHLAMCLALQEAAIAVTISNPAWIKYFGRSEGVLAKNDPIDAALIERFANAKRPAADPPITREQIALNELVSHRAQLVTSRTRLLTSRQQLLDPAVRKEVDRAVAALERCITRAERRLKEKVDANPLWKEKVARLSSVNGLASSLRSSCWRRCPSSAASAAANVLPSAAWLRMMMIVALATADAPSAEVARTCVAPCIWPHSARRHTTPF
jgi:transposase